MIAKDEEGLFIPRALFFDKELSWIEKLIVLEVAACMLQNGGYCEHKNQELADYIQTSQCNVSLAVSRLERREIIEVKHLQKPRRMKLLKFKSILSYLLNFKRALNNNESKDIINKDSFLSEKNPSTLASGEGYSDVLFSSPNYKRYNRPAHPLVEYYFEHDGVRRCMPNTKAYNECVNRVIELLRGLLNEHRFDQRWIKQKDIPQVWISERHKWTEEEVKRGLKRLSFLYDPEYWPEDKTAFKRMTLAKLIYNPHKGTSWFLAVVRKPVEKLYSYVAKEAEGLKIADEWVREDWKNIKKLDQLLSKMRRFYESLPAKVFEYGDFAHFCPTWTDLLKRYVNWLEENHQAFVSRTEYKERLFDCSGELFRRYLDQHWGSDSNAAGKRISYYLPREDRKKS